MKRTQNIRVSEQGRRAVWQQPAPERPVIGVFSRTSSSQNLGHALLLACLVAAVYIFYLPGTLFPGDSADFLASIVTHGIPHPPGYPLYTSMGIALSLFPLGTVLTLTGLLSVIPAVGAIVLLNNLLWLLTGKRSVAAVAALSLAFTYPFWLYSEVVEVFSLNSFFTVLLLWLMIRWYREGQKSYVFLAALVFGLSLSHHLIILFLLPVLLYFFILRPFPKSLILPCLLLLCAGLLPYAYLPIAAWDQPQINWMGTPTWRNFLSMISREGYGTFRSANQIGHEPVLRAANLYAFADLLLKDFRIFGCLMIAAGFWHIIRTGRTWLLMVLTLAAGSYLFFLFYASFPLMTDFLLGTFERFILPLYIILTIPLAFGLLQVRQWIHSIARRKSLSLAVMGILAFYPVGLFLLNQPKLRAIQHDPSTERIGADVLASAPPNSVVLISMDIPLFSSQYMRYVHRVRLDVQLIHVFKLWLPAHRDSLVREFPTLYFPQSAASSDVFMQEFLDKNAGNTPVLSTVPFADEHGQWVPWGLLYRYVPDAAPLPLETIIAENARLWSQYQLPWSAEERTMKPLLMTDIARIYAQARTETGFFLATKGKVADAEEHLLGALQWDPMNADAYLTLSQVAISLKRCDDALAHLEKLKDISPDDPAVSYAFYLTYTQCFTDAQKAKEYHELYEQKMKQSETSLKEL